MSSPETPLLFEVLHGVPANQEGQLWKMIKEKALFMKGLLTSS
jgi:hypothetical protein